MLRIGDIVSGAVLAALGFYIMTSSLKWTYFSPSGPGPGYFPFWYGLLILVLALILAGKGLIVLRRGATPSEKEDQTSIGRPLASCAALAVATLLIYPLGMLLSFSLLAFFLVKVIFRRSVRDGVLVALIGSAVLYGIFVIGLQMQLPLGLLGS
jgi:putative tricarboxylic transport membrane protein